MAEVLVYFIAMGKEARRFPFYWLTLIGLCLIPVYRKGYFNDFSLKTPLPMLFLLMILLLKTYYSTGKARRKAVILFVLAMGFMTSVVEIRRNAGMTLQYRGYPLEFVPFASFETVDTGLEVQNNLFTCQYLAPATEDDIWIRYIEKRHDT